MNAETAPSPAAGNARRLRRFVGARSPAARIVAVAKTFPAAAVRAAHAGGITDIGENYLQEAEGKIAACADLPLAWHFTGAVQRNKTARIAALFDWVHGVDRLAVGARLSDARAGKAPLNIFLQVNADNEAGKAGAPLAQAAALAARLAALPNLRLRGLMAVPAARTDAQAQYAAFCRIADAQAAIVAGGVPLDCLSLGMSGDFEQALRAGATHVRLGTAIFGARARKEQREKTA